MGWPEEIEERVRTKDDRVIIFWEIIKRSCDI
jgi:hypothetical protein